MKVLVLLAVLTVAAFANQQEWEKFKLTHFKQYSNFREEKLRFEIFKDNLQKIQEHNSQYAVGEFSYFLTVNKFADLTREEFAIKRTTHISTKPEYKTSIFVKEPNFSAPTQIDWREKGAVLDVKDQGDCGSCWAFSTTGALEGQNARHNNKKVPLSEQELVDCTEDYANVGCAGGRMDESFEYVRDHGLCSEESYPYIGVDSTCKSCILALGKIKGYVDVEQNEDALKDAVASIGPISIALNADEHWQFYGGGIFDHKECNGTKLNHGVLVVGYDDNCWIIKNSWGLNWGEDGYIRLVKGKEQCGLQRMASYPEL